MSVVTLPYVFVGGTRAIAEQVNADFNAVANAVNTNVRNFITGPTTFYVAPNGVDAPGNGFGANSPAATVTYILGLLRSEHDLNNQQVTIQLANGTYGELVTNNGVMLGLQNPLNLVIQGNMSQPSQVVWTVNGNAFYAVYGALMTLQGITIQATNGACIAAAAQSIVAVQNVIFGSGNPGGSHMVATKDGAIQVLGNYAISGGAEVHASATEGGQLFLDAPGTQVALSNTPNFTTAFAYATNLGVMRITAVFNGAATGSRSFADRNASINIEGQGAAYLPGSTDGTTSNGGITI